MMRKGGESPEEEKARFKESRRFCKARRGDPRRAARHRLRARRPGDLPDLGARASSRSARSSSAPATSGYHLDFDVRYLWMRQKQIIGSHFANAWEATKANELIEQWLIRPVLWQTMGFEGVAEAHQLHARQQAPRQDRDPRRRRERRARARPPRARARSARRSAPDGRRTARRRRSHPLVRDAVPRRQARGGARARSRRVALRYGATRVRACYRSRDDRVQVHADGLVRATSSTSSATGTARSSSPSAPSYSGWYQVPILYEWHDRAVRGALEPEPRRTPSEPSPTPGLHPAQNRALRECYAAPASSRSHWQLAESRLGRGADGDGARRAGRGARRAELLEELARPHRGYGLYGLPAAQGVGARLAGAAQRARRPRAGAKPGAADGRARRPARRDALGVPGRAGARNGDDADGRVLRRAGSAGSGRPGAARRGGGGGGDRPRRGDRCRRHGPARPRGRATATARARSASGSTAARRGA